MLALGPVGCSSLGGADGSSLFADDCCDVPATGGAGGAGGTGGAAGADSSSSLPPLGMGLAGAMPRDPGGGTPVNQPGMMSPTVQGPDTGNSSAAPDAGEPDEPPGPNVRADAGSPGADPSTPPEPADDPACSGLALELDGSTFAAVPRVVEDDFTLEAWIKTSDSLSGPSGFNGRAIFDSDVIGMGSPNDFAVTVLNDRIAFAVGGPDTTVQGLQAVTSDAWAHVAVTRRASNGQLQIILNGALEAVATAPNRAPLTGRPDLAFGGFSVPRKFIGAIDEVRVWNLVRSVDQISANMHARLSGSEQGLVGYYTFEDQGSALTADSSASAIPATLTGSPTYVASAALCAP